MKYDSAISLKARIDSFNIETDDAFSRITLSYVIFDQPILNDLFLILNEKEMVEIEIKRLRIEHDGK